MKTRIVHTKIWEDDWFRELSKPAGWLFMYLITNPRINLSGMYQLSLAALLFGTRFEEKEIELLKSELAQKGKVFFYRDWVYVVNAKKYGGYSGKLCDQGISKEMQEVPDEIKKCFLEGKCDTPSIPLARGSKVQEIINNKLEIRNKKKSAEKIEDLDSPEALKKRFTLTPEQLAELTEQFPAVEVKFEYEKARDHLLANGGKRGKTESKPIKDYMAYLRNWMRKDWVKKKPFVFAPAAPAPNEPEITPEKRKENLRWVEEQKAKIREKMGFRK